MTQFFLLAMQNALFHDLLQKSPADIKLAFLCLRDSHRRIGVVIAVPCSRTEPLDQTSRARFRAWGSLAVPVALGMRRSLVQIQPP